MDILKLIFENYIPTFHLRMKVAGEYLALS